MVSKVGSDLSETWMWPLVITKQEGGGNEHCLDMHCMTYHAGNRWFPYLFLDHRPSPQGEAGLPWAVRSAKWASAGERGALKEQYNCMCV